MKLLTCFAAALIFTGLAAPASALWEIAYRQPEIKDSDDGMMMFQVVHPRAENEDKVVRTAKLTLSDGKRILMQMDIEPSISRSGLIYAFRVQPDLVKFSKLEISERILGDSEQENLVPHGGTIYEYAVREGEPATPITTQREIACPVAPPTETK